MCILYRMVDTIEKIVIHYDIEALNVPNNKAYESFVDKT